MPNTKPLSLPNLIQLKKTHPQVYEDLVTMQSHINKITNALGGIAAPVASGGINVTATNGIIDVQITDKHPQTGEDYVVEYDSQPSFASAHVVLLGPVRNFRIGNLNGLTTYWRWYKSTKLGGVSNRITFGNPPTAVVAGNLSVGSPGPTPQPSQGSGPSQIPGYGYGSPNQNINRKLPNVA